MGCVLPSKRKKTFDLKYRIPQLKSSLLEKKPHSSEHEVHFDEDAVRQSLVKESKENISSSNPNPHQSQELKRTNTPNFRKNVAFESKIIDEESNKIPLASHDEDDDSNSDTQKKPLMKSPTFSRNITTSTKKMSRSTNFVFDPPTNPSFGDFKSQSDSQTNPALFKKTSQTEFGGQSTVKTRFFPSKHPINEQSPKNINGLPLRTNSSAGTNLESISLSNQRLEKLSSNPKMETKGQIQKNSDSAESKKSLDRINEEDGNLKDSPERKSARKAAPKSPLNGENKEFKFPISNGFNNMFKTNLIDLFRNEERATPSSTQSILANNNAAMATSVFNKNSKKNITLNGAKVSQQSIPSNSEVNFNAMNPMNNAPNLNSNVKEKENNFEVVPSKVSCPPKFFHINPNANLISMFKESHNLNVGEDDNHNFITGDDDGPSPINRPPNNLLDVEHERETSLNISTFENVCSNDVTNSNIIEKSEVNRTTLNNVDDISKDLSKYSINADCLNVEYDDKKGQKDPSPSNYGNILSGLNSPSNKNNTDNNNNNNRFSQHQKTFGFSGMKSSSKQHKTAHPTEEKKFLSPTISKKQRPQASQDKFKLRSLTMKEIDDSGEEKQSPSPEAKDSNSNMMTNSISPDLVKKPDLSNNNKLDVSNRVPKSPASSMVSARLQRAKTTLEAENSVVHTSKLDITKDEQGNKKINQYNMIKDLGKGGFGKVKLAVNDADKKNYAIKIANKKKLKRKLLSRSTSAYTLLEKEVATMKKLLHPNIVRLFEVIDDAQADKLYLVMEYMKKGAILSKTYFKYEEKTLQEDLNFDAMIQKQKLMDQQDKKTLTYEKAQKYFRDFLLVHTYANVMHRDLKPENLLVDEDDVLKIADFGVSSIMENGNDQLSNNAGTKAFLAPETWDGKPFKGKKADVWAAAATLYYLVVGRLPFHATNAEDLRKKIQEDKTEFPADMPASLQDLILKGLEKNPEKRITVPMMMNHPWVTDNGTNPLENFLEEEEFEISEKEIKNAMTKISFRATIMLTYKLKQSLNRTRSRIMQRKASNASNNCSQMDVENI